MNTRRFLARTALAVAAVAMLASSALAGNPSAQGKLNKATARRVFDEVLTRARFEVSDGLYTNDFVAHGGGGKRYTHAEDLDAAKWWRAAFPDLEVRVDFMVAEGDLVAVRWTARGTNTGAGNGLPATGKRAEASGITVFRFVGGKIAEEWSSYDGLSVLRQLGLFESGSK